MNKTDMSNPAQYAAYLQAYIAQRRQISYDMPIEGMEWSTEWELLGMGWVGSGPTGVRSVAKELDSPKNS